MTRRKAPAQPSTEARGRYAVAPSPGAAGRVAEPPPFFASGPAATVVTATEAARHFSDLVSRVCYQHETFVIERGGRALCQLAPVDAGACTGSELLALLTRLPRPDDAFLDAVEQIGRAQPPVEESPWPR